MDIEYIMFTMTKFQDFKAIIAGHQMKFRDKLQLTIINSNTQIRKKHIN